MQQEAMEDDKNNPKYAKLLAEYSKLRAQAKVLKNAVVEERNRTSVLQESMRIKDQNFRRAESELDSQNFRNKQMERRIESLQNDLQAYQQKGSGGGSKANKMRDNQLSSGNGEIDPIIIEELQRRIIENAQFASTISDKNNEIEMYTNRIKDLELQVAKQMHDHAEVEKRLRKDVEVLMTKNTEIETKIIEKSSSQMGSEGDTTSLASDSTMPLHALLGASNNSQIDDRIVFLEKELNHYRTQYELLKINDALRMDEHLIIASSQTGSINNHMSFSQPQQQRKVLSSQSSTSTTSSMSNNNNNHSTFVNYPTSSQSSGSKSSPCLNSKSLPEPSTSLKCDDDQNSEPMNRDQMVYEMFSKRFEELFQEKCKAESKVINYVTECESLKNNIEILVQDLEEKDKMLNESQTSFIRLEEDFLTTRVNYEDQICVLTDQVISLSDQLSSR